MAELWTHLQSQGTLLSTVVYSVPEVLLQHLLSRSFSNPSPHEGNEGNLSHGTEHASATFIFKD